MSRNPSSALARLQLHFHTSSPVRYGNVSEYVRHQSDLTPVRMLTGSFAAPLSFSKYLTSSESILFITLSACHFLKLNPTPSWL